MCSCLWAERLWLRVGRALELGIRSLLFVTKKILRMSGKCWHNNKKKNKSYPREKIEDKFVMK